jgi:hypothetical protein
MNTEVCNDCNSVDCQYCKYENPNVSESPELAGSLTEALIVSNRDRETLDMGEFYFLYIPLTDRERKRLSPETINACLRVRIEK